MIYQAPNMYCSHKTQPKQWTHHIVSEGQYWTSTVKCEPQKLRVTAEWREQNNIPPPPSCRSTHSRLDITAWRQKQTTPVNSGDSCILHFYRPTSSWVLSSVLRSAWASHSCATPEPKHQNCPNHSTWAPTVPGPSWNRCTRPGEKLHLSWQHIHVSLNAWAKLVPWPHQIGAVHDGTDTLICILSPEWQMVQPRWESSSQMVKYLPFLWYLI